jgi:hypothetical protein
MGNIILACEPCSAVSGIARRYRVLIAKDVDWTHDKRRRHHHWLVKVVYFDGNFFGRVYVDPEKAKKFSARQRKSPVVKSARILQLS